MQTLHYKHNIMGIKLWELYYGYYDWMAFIIVILLEEITTSWKPVCSNWTKNHIQVYSAFN